MPSKKAKTNAVPVPPLTPAIPATDEEFEQKLMDAFTESAPVLMEVSPNEPILVPDTVPVPVSEHKDILTKERGPLKSALTLILSLWAWASHQLR